MHTLNHKDVTSTQLNSSTYLTAFGNIHHVLLILVAVQLDTVRPCVTFELRLWLWTWQFVENHQRKWRKLRKLIHGAQKVTACHSLSQMNMPLENDETAYNYHKCTLPTQGLATVKDLSPGNTWTVRHKHITSIMRTMCWLSVQCWVGFRVALTCNTKLNILLLFI